MPLPLRPLEKVVDLAFDTWDWSNIDLTFKTLVGIDNSLKVWRFTTADLKFETLETAIELNWSYSVRVDEVILCDGTRIMLQDGDIAYVDQEDQLWDIHIKRFKFLAQIVEK